MPGELEGALAVCDTSPCTDPTEGKAHAPFPSPLCFPTAFTDSLGGRGIWRWEALGYRESKSVHLRHRLQQQYVFQMGGDTGQEKTNCQQHRMSWEKDKGKGIS